VTVHQDDGATVQFARTSSGTYVGAGPWVQAKLVKEAGEEGSYIYTLPDKSKLEFNSSGLLTSETDRNGNTLTMNRSSEGVLESVSDGSGRKLSGEGFVESATDPMGHTVKDTYESGNLASVTQPGEASLRWQVKCNSEHELTNLTDGRSHTTSIEYDGTRRVVAQTDPMSRKRTWKYTLTEAGEPQTTLTEPNGSETVEQFNGAGLPTSITRASGTAIAATTSYEYDGSYNLIAVTDPNKHTTKYGYDAAGDRTSDTDPNRNSPSDRQSCCPQASPYQLLPGVRPASSATRA
jgi:YD repeat-containing protein